MVTHVTRTIVIFLRVNDLLCSFHLQILISNNYNYKNTI